MCCGTVSRRPSRPQKAVAFRRARRFQRRAGCAGRAQIEANQAPKAPSISFRFFPFLSANRSLSTGCAGRRARKKILCPSSRRVPRRARPGMATLASSRSGDAAQWAGLEVVITSDPGDDGLGRDSGSPRRQSPSARTGVLRRPMAPRDDGLQAFLRDLRHAARARAHDRSAARGGGRTGFGGGGQQVVFPSGRRRTNIEHICKPVKKIVGFPSGRRPAPRHLLREGREPAPCSRASAVAFGKSSNWQPVRSGGRRAFLLPFWRRDRVEGFEPKLFA